MIRQAWLLLAGIMCCIHLRAQIYVPVTDSSQVNFTIKNLGVNVKGAFSDLQGSILFDPGHPEKSTFDVSVAAASVNTGNHKRDEHLCKPVFLDCDQYPRIKFQAVKVSPGKKAGTFFMDGTLTIKGMTLPVSFPFSVTPTTGGYWLEGNFGMRRKPYGVGKTSTVSNKLRVFLKVLAKRA